MTRAGASAAPRTHNVVVNKWIGRTATEIATAVQTGEVTAREVVAAHLDRIAAINAELGAFVRIRQQAALAEADAVDARPDGLPLAGVPVGIKDNVPVAGEPMRIGSLAVPDEPQAADHPLVTRLRSAGAVVVGLTAMPELATYPFTDSGFGIARNPWDRSRTPGGSSGGGAAAVAAAMIPIAQGNDGLGSIRIPAAACGLFGLKPGPGVVPAEVGVDSWGGLLENGPLTTTVADAALMLGVMAGTSYELAEPSSLRIAVSVKPPGPGIIVHPALRAVTRKCGALLAKSGHAVDRADPPYPLWATPAMIERWFTVAAREAKPYLKISGLESRTRKHARAGQVLGRLHRQRDDSRERLRAAFKPFFERYDVLVMPSLATTAPAARRWGEGSWLRSIYTAIAFTPMTGIWNMAGFPAASVPSGAVGAMPGAVQLVAAPGQEPMLLNLAAQIERTAGWRRHAPDYDPAAALA
jgi:amidase